MSTLNNFITEIKTKGLMRTANYSVDFVLPKKLRNSGHNANQENLQKILLFCDKIDMPGINVATVANRTFGEVRETPYDRQYGTISMTFFMDNNMVVKKLFDDWVNTIQNPHTRLFGWYSDYITDIIISVEDLMLNKRYSIELYECYPKDIAGITLDYASKDIMRLTVTMNYKNWIATPMVVQANGDSLPSNDSSLGRTLADVNLGFNQDYINNFNLFQDQYNSVAPESTNIFSGITKLFS